MKAASCFSGIGAPEVSLPGADWLWHAEIEPFPCAVMAERHPASVNLGDVLAGDFLDRAAGPLDLLVGGPPCQSFSVAGLRKGLADPRGNLTLRWVQILHAIRPRNAVTENVPGWLNSRDNAFGCFLGALVGGDDALRSPLDEGRWPDQGMASGPRARLAWRVLDAQHFGLAQRRKRVFVVADFGDGADPAAVLFERKGVPGDIAPSREAGEVVAALSASGVGSCGADDNQGQAGHLIASTGNVAHCLNAGAMGRQDYETETVIAHSLPGEGFDASEDGTGRGTPIVAEPYTLASRGRGDGQRLEYRQDGTANAVLTPNGGRAGIGVGAIAFSSKDHGADAADDNLAQTMGRKNPLAIADAWAVRRLTPVECARLQGFPDTYLDIAYRGKPAADGPKYKALGNSMAVPVVGWILRRIEALQSAERLAA
jgi:DNA (cytosine-5)-methyltransferase 1